MAHGDAAEKRRTLTTSTRASQSMRYQLRIVDTDRHTFKHVIWALTKVFGYDVEHALLKAKEAHAVGDAVVFTSHLELIELKQEQLAALPQSDAGPIVTTITEVRDGVRS